MRPLKPFEGPSPTGFYNFNGKPLEQEEVDKLRASGVRIPEKPFAWNPEIKKSEGYVSAEWDIMPDNRLKDTKFRKKRLDNRKAALKASLDDPNHVHNPAYQQARWDAYQALPEPKPDYFEWAAQYNRREMYDNLERIAFNSTRDSDRTKAALAILEFSKSKPKAIVETISSDVRPATPDELIAAIAMIADKPVEYIKEALFGKAQ